MSSMLAKSLNHDFSFDRNQMDTKTAKFQTMAKYQGQSSHKATAQIHAIFQKNFAQESHQLYWPETQPSANKAPKKRRNL
ncbi:hypothetical protein L596_023864 [Steinernema carpocapsae]|uniref:Uncharacterized protein n=1 Tax=Steinernema carpocapsae TaxID=34508 RepID=A0A4U5MEY0_STECR|nr:hypothetical protein L596_023864 [Steinernema carpocapsae]